MWHRPWYSSNDAHDAEGAAMQASMEGLFAQFKVDLALVGHVHAYERVAAMVKGQIQAGGTAYITIGNGGTPEGLAKKWKDPQPAWSEFRLSEWGYARLRVFNATHAHWSMWGDNDGKLLDDHWYVRQRG